MKKRTVMSVLSLGLAAAVLVGCTSLSDVQTYAVESAQLAGYPKLTDRFRDTYLRERPYLGPTGHCDENAAKQQDELRQAAYPDLVKMQTRLAEYMAMLASLAGDEAFSLDASISELGGSIKLHPDLGVSAQQVDAYTQLGVIISRRFKKGLQQKAIRDTVVRADPQVQALTAGMSLMVDGFSISNSHEKGCVVDFLEQESAFAARRRDGELAAAIGRQLAMDKAAEYSQVDAALAEAKQGTQRIGEGHAALKENVDSLSARELIATLQLLTDDISKAKAAIATL